MKKKTCFIAMVCAVLLATQGCGFEEQMEIFSDGSSQVTVHTYSTEEEENTLLKEAGYAGVNFSTMMTLYGFTYEGEEVINNKEHHKYTHTQTLNAEETSSQFVVKNEDKAVIDYAGLSSFAELEEVGGKVASCDFNRASIKFPNTIVNSNIESDVDMIKMDLNSKFNQDRVYVTFKEGITEKKI